MNETTAESSAKLVVDLEEKIRVLHVDDDVGILKITKQCIETEAPVQVDTAISVEEALKKLKNETYDVIVSDYQMPIKDGLEFLKILRENGNTTPFVMFTGKGREEVAISALNLGANQYLNKVGDPETVYTELAHSIIELSKVRKEGTRAKKVEEDLKESEEKYRELFESIRDPVCIYVGKEGHLIDYNTAFKELFGYTDEELKSKVFLDFVHPDDQAMVLQKYHTKYPAEEFPIVYEIRVTNKKGESIPLEISVSPYKRKSRGIGIEVVHRDITERKRYEERLSALNTHGQNLNMAKTVEEAYNLTLDAAKKTLGFEFADIFIAEGETLHLMTHIGKTKISSASLPMNGKKGITVRAARTGKPVYVPDIRKDEAYVEGEEGARSEITVPIKTRERVLGVLNVESGKLAAFNEKDQELLEILASHLATAISNLDRAKNLETYAQEIRESKEKFERFFMDNPEAAVYLDPSFHILDVNPRFMKLFGYSANEVKGKHINEAIVPEDKRIEGEMLDKKALKGYVCYDSVRKRKDGTLVPVSVSAAPITVQGKLLGTVGLYTDVSERKRFEERLSALHAHSRDLNMAENMKEIYRMTLDAMEKTLGFEIAFFMIVDKDMLCMVDHHGYPESFSIKLPLDGTKKGVSVKVATTGRSIYVPNAEKDNDWVKFIPDIRSALLVPVKIGVKVLGVLGVDSKSLNAFNEKDQELLEILASHAATAISNLDRAKNLETYTREIRESREKFERLFMDNPEAVVYLDPDLRILDVNPCFTKLFGYLIDEVKGGHIDDFVVPRDKMEEAKMLGREFMKGQTYCDTVRKKKDGSLVSVSISGGPIRIGDKIIGTLALYKDITERRHYEASLSALNVYSRSLNLAKTVEEVYELTLDAAEKTLGFEFADILMVEGRMLRLVIQRGRAGNLTLELPMDGVKGITVRVARTGKPVLVPDVDNDGAYVDVGLEMRSELAVPIKIGHKVVGVLNAERKEVNAFDEKDQELLEILASHVATAISNLEYSHALELMNEKLRVTGGLTRHDVRNKLATVTGNVYLLKKRLIGDNDMLDKLKAIENAVQQTVRIFDFAKAYEMLGVEELSYVDVAKMFDESVSLFPSSMNVNISNECRGLVVLADPLLRQLFYNLIDNSLKYGQKVSRIRVYYRGTAQDTPSLVYEDDGVGIPAAEKPNLFKQGYSTGGSTGYGLYLISKIVEVYGWTIQETGNPGQGAQFKITIPKVSKNGKENLWLG